MKTLKIDALTGQTLNEDFSETMYELIRQEVYAVVSSFERKVELLRQFDKGNYDNVQYPRPVRLWLKGASLRQKINAEGVFIDAVEKLTF